MPKLQKKKLNLKKINTNNTKNVIKETIEAAEISAGTTVVEVYTSIGGSQVTSLPSTGVVGADPKGGNREVEIKMEAKNRALDCAQAVSIPLNEILLHILPQEYLVDGREYANPIGIKEAVLLSLKICLYNTVIFLLSLDFSSAGS